MPSPILVGAVVYDPKVVVIWEIIKDFFKSEGCPMDSVFYSNYELQVDALLAGHIHIAWNSPLAWVDAQRRNSGKCRAIAMRDTDRDRITHWIVRQAKRHSAGRRLARKDGRDGCQRFPSGDFASFASFSCGGTGTL